MSIRCCCGNRQWNSLPIGAHVMLTSEFTPICRVWPCFFASAKGPDRTAIQCGTRPVNLVGFVQIGQKNLMQLVPHTCVVPGFEIFPAGHSTTAAHFLGQIFPRDACLEHENNSCENLPPIQ